MWVIPAGKNIRKCNGFNGNCIGFNGNYNGVYWYVMDSIGGMIFVHNGILMEIIGISVMVSIGLLVFVF